MPQNNVTIWLEFSMQQMAAESYFQGITDLSDPQLVKPRLLSGNNPPGFSSNNYTRFTDQLADRFLDTYEIIDQHANDASGFSATLFFDTQTNSYTLSFRSTEYKNSDDGGDWERDGLPGADGEIFSYGFAFAQLASMEAYYQKLNEDGTLPAGAELNVTGYSLGGHLATVFTELHADEVTHTYTFNGAGRGTISGGMPGLSESERIGEMVNALLAELKAIDPDLGFFTSGAAGSLYANAQYQDALATVIGQFGPSSLALSDISRSDGPFALITQLVGHATHGDQELVANSGIHAPSTSIFIEDQPNLDGFGGFFGLNGDFGTTHSITLIVDSLALMETFQAVDPNVTQATLEQIFSASSNQTGSGFVGVSGVAEGNSLESALDALRKVFLGNVEQTDFGRQTGDFGDLAFRNPFYQNVGELEGAVEQEKDEGATFQIVNLVPFSASAIAGAAERTDAEDPNAIAYRYALLELNPFAITGDVDYITLHDTNGELDLFDPATGVGLTNQYLNARAEFLVEMIVINLADAAQSSGVIHFDDRTTGYEITTNSIITTDQEFIFGSDASEADITGNSKGDHLYGGGGDDTLTGNGGNDYLEGDAGNDLLEGGAGFDTYVYRRNDNLDTITDSDHSGIIFYDTHPVDGGIRQGTDPANTYRGGAQGAMTYVWSGPGTDLTINNLITVPDFQNGDLGIQLTSVSDTQTPGPQPTEPTIDFSNTLPLRTEYFEFLPFSPGSTNGYALQLTPANDPTGFYLYPNDPQNGHGFDGYTIYVSEEPESPLFQQYTGDAYIVRHLDGDAVTVFGGPGSDQLYVDGGWGVLLGDAGNDQLFGGAGNDEFLGETGDDYLNGGDGNDRLIGGEGNDVLYGGAGDDLMYGSNSSSSNSGYPLALGSDYLDGGEGDDTLHGGSGNNTLLGGDGNDLLYGDDPYNPAATGNNYLDGGAGDDTLYGGSGNSTLLGGDGNDQLTAGEGDNLLDGSGDADILTVTGTGSNTLLGGAGDDQLNSGGGNDLLDGGAGNDLLVGGAGMNTILFGRGSGQDTVNDAGNVQATDVIQFAGGVSPGDVTVREDTNLGLVLSITGTTDQITLSNFFSSSFSQVIQVAFADGTVWGESVLNGPGVGVSDVITAGPGNNMISAGGGDDTIIGGAGNDTLDGGRGNDTYVFNLNDGTDTIIDTDKAGEVNTVAFGDAITPDSLSLGLGSLLIQYGNQGDAIHIMNFDPNNALGTHAIDTFQFTDGTVLSYSDLIGRGFDLTGTDGNDVIIGTNVVDRIVGLGGTDTLSGGAGDDTYRFNLGDGVDTIHDVSTVGEGNSVQFGAGITATDLTFTRDHDNRTLTIAYGAGGDAIQLAVFNPNTDNIVAGSLVVSTLHFADGSSINMSDLFPKGTTLFGTDGNDVLAGTPGDDILIGGAGDDELVGGAGNDVLIGDGIGPDGPGDGGPPDPGGGPPDPGGGPLDPGGGLPDPGDGLPMGGDPPVAGGNDVLLGGAGNDIYVFNLGDGVDTIHDVSTAGEGNGIVFGDGITQTDLTFSQNQTDHALTIAYGVGGDTIQLDDFDPNNFTGSLVVSTLNFADGSLVDMAGLFPPTDVNHPPIVVNPLADQNTLEDSLFSFAAPGDTFADVDASDTLTYSATQADGGALPAWLSFDSATATFSGTPSNDDVGTFNVTVTAKDIGALSAADTFALTVVNVNDAPALVHPIADQGTVDDVPFSLVVPGDTFADVDAGGTLTLSASRADGSLLPTWLAFDPATGAFSGTAGVDNIGALALTVTATDRDGLSAAATFGLTVTPAPDQVVVGTDGADVLVGRSGNDTLTGGAGDDLLDGGTGNDTYVYSLGNGLDQITDLAGLDTVSFGAGISFDTVVARVTTAAGLTTAHLRLLDACGCELTDQGMDIPLDAGGVSPIERFAFADGTTFALSDLVIEATATEGTNGSDVVLTGRHDDVIAAGNGDDLVSAGTGHDTVYAGNGKDSLYGEGGNDTLYGGNSEDLLNGGCGGDVLYGGNGKDMLQGRPGDDLLDSGNGQDTILFARGDGQDTLSGHSNNQGDAIQFSSDINPMDLVLSRQANDLRIAIHGEGDQITIQDWYAGRANHAKEFQTGDGSVLQDQQVDQLIQAMANFSAESGLTWDQAIEQRPQDVQAILAASWQ